MEIKTNQEIAIMEEGGKILAKVLKISRDYCKKGISSLELDNLIEENIHKYKAIPSFKNYKGYPFSSCISINEEIVHGLPKKKLIKSGDIVSIDVGVYYKGFHNDAAISFYIDKAPENIHKLINVTSESLSNGINIIRPGIRIGDVQSIIQKTIEDAGFSAIRDLSGHGIGRKLQEPPSIPNLGIKGTGFLLKEGMTFCLEPMVSQGNYKVVTLNDGWTVSTYDKSLSAHFEHTVAVTQSGHKILTTID